ncbi:uncharacterized protein MONBRDRAFT_38529 [Monosiga brevicollis MX1]|uniref:Autophagy-related protein 18 n=1 Tax=Monosiga brevicollis TaxID=81824 RepID=A9V8I2_MONBE|nr:uncharacterized protein MONBRDRAFT_38529 [Monosiga brevicollis MX1]EDQ86149.1 predicted protein [Monosiga brevicollis MX1]|eukprot:XP_001749074.1 hypothetical protein [Monosiga brevicollis MX1]
MNRQRLVLLLEDTIYIYDVTNLNMYTPAMEHSSAAEEPPVFHYLAYPSKPGSGEVNVYDVIAMRIVTTISAHQTELACLEFSNRGDRLATASVKGTVFRVFDSTNGDKLFELRRGYSTTALIRHMTFSEDANWLCVSSNKSTVHVFKLFQAEAPPAEASWSSYLSSTLQYAAGYLPTTVTEVWTQERSFAQAMLPEDVGEHIATMGGTPESPTIMVVSHDGWLFQYNINVIEGGECGTPRKHRVDGSDAKPAEDAAAHKPSTP